MEVVATGFVFSSSIEMRARDKTINGNFTSISLT